MPNVSGRFTPTDGFDPRRGGTVKSSRIRRSRGATRPVGIPWPATFNDMEVENKTSIDPIWWEPEVAMAKKNETLADDDDLPRRHLSTQKTSVLIKFGPGMP
ncbi:Uncharacterised protein at_DN1581 [Pycnogonum litorale]